MTTKPAEPANWATGALHVALVQFLPAYVVNPFSTPTKVNVSKLAAALGRSNEGVYRWLRASRLEPVNAQAIVALAGTQENIDALKTLGRKPPKIEDLTAFVFA